MHEVPEFSNLFFGFQSIDMSVYGGRHNRRVVASGIDEMVEAVLGSQEKAETFHLEFP
jgi:hypothetical protein